KVKTGYRQTFTLPGCDVVRIRQSNPGLSASDEIDHRGIAIDQKWPLRVEGAAPLLPFFVAPVLAQGHKMCGSSPKQRICQRNFARRERNRQVAQPEVLTVAGDQGDDLEREMVRV